MWENRRFGGVGGSLVEYVSEKTPPPPILRIMQSPSNRHLIIQGFALNVSASARVEGGGETQAATSIIRACHAALLH